MLDAAYMQLVEALSLNSRHPYFYLEVTFLGIIAYLLLQKAYTPKKKLDDDTQVDESKLQKIVDEWKPQPLVPANGSEGTKPQTVLTSTPGPHVRLQDDPVDYVNFVTNNFLSLVGNDKIAADCRQVIEKYGVGSCGPRGFYGSIDVHIECERAIAKFMGTETAILYSYDAATPSSVIPAFAKKEDLIFADQGVNYSIKTGLELSKSKCVFFRHNDMNDLAAKLEEQAQRDRDEPPKALNRRFIVIEGIYQNYGDIAPLRKLVELRDKYKYRLIIDESLSVGVLGKTGRGLTEHVGLSIADVDITCASMSNAIGSVGGFCVGENEIVKHQRLSGAGYCYSASLPPYISKGSTTALQIIDAEPERLVRLRENIQYAREVLATLQPVGLTILADDETDSAERASPLFHVRLTSDDIDDDSRLQDLQEACKKRGVLVGVSNYSTLEASPPPATLRLTIISGHSKADIDACAEVLRLGMQEISK